LRVPDARTQPASVTLFLAPAAFRSSGALLTKPRPRKRSLPPAQIQNRLWKTPEAPRNHLSQHGLTKSHHRTQKIPFAPKSQPWRYTETLYDACRDGKTNFCDRRAQT